MTKVSIQYDDSESGHIHKVVDGHFRWKVYVDGKFYASGKTKGDAGAIVDEYLTDNPNSELSN